MEEGDVEPRWTRSREVTRSEEKERCLNFKARPETVFLWRLNLFKFP